MRALTGAGGRLRPLTLSTFLRLLVAVSLAVWGMTVAFEQAARSQSPAPSEPPTIHLAGHVTYPNERGLIFVAVLGSDAPTGSADEEGHGCDSIHIIAINSTAKLGTIINIPRDSFIEGRKITDICRSQGFEGGIAALKRYTGIPIQFMAHTNFSNFMRLIDALGGLDIHVYQSMHNPGDTGTHFDPGDYHMQGGDALAFSRDRYNTPGGDFGRSTDQAQEILSGFRKFHKEGLDMAYIFDVIRAGRQRASFNVPLPDLIKLALIAREIDPSKVQSCTVAGVATTAGGASIVALAGSNSAIFQNVAKDATLPAGAQCFMGVNFQIPAR